MVILKIKEAEREKVREETERERKKTDYKHTTSVGGVNKGYMDLGFEHFRNIAGGLAEGWLMAHPFQVVEGGLDGLEEALKNLKDGKASVVKYVYGIEETEGGQKESRISEGIEITSLYHSCILFFQAYHLAA
jgi:hypothetical protein